MSRDNTSGDSGETTRRGFVTGASALVGAGLLGVGSVSSVSAQEDIDTAFTNIRVREAKHAWERGYRGRTDRTLAATDSGADSRHPDIGPWSGVTATTEDGELEVDGNPFNNTGGKITPGTTKLVGWHNDHDSYGGFEKPRDENGHGTHVASIMAGSGRASAFDPDRYQEDNPHAVLLAGDTISYEVDAEEGTGVFASAYGDAIELVIEGPDGEELATSGGASGTSEVTFENNIAETPTVHDDGEATYTVHVRAIEGELISSGRLERIAVGAFKHPSDTVGDRTADGDLSLHAGIAPNASMMMLTDLSSPTRDLGEHADAFAETFNIRAVNMSWGYIGGLPLGATGLLDDIPEFITEMTEAGMLTVAAAGNSVTPANGNGSPAVANEAISVVATGPYDGIAGYSSGGLAGIDDFENPYMKPDVTAPGGQINVLDLAARNGEPEEEVRTNDGDEEAVGAELEPVRELEEVTDEQLTPTTEFDPEITGDADYEIDLATEVEDELLLNDEDTEAMRHGPKREGMGGDGTESDREYRGMAPDVTLTAYATNASLTLLKATSAYDHLLTLQEEGEHTIHLASNSYGAGPGEFDPYDPLNVATWYAYEANVLVSFSAGNDGPDNDTLGQRKQAPYVMNVAAAHDDQSIADFSSRGDVEGNHDRETAFENVEALYSGEDPDGPLSLHRPSVATKGADVMSTLNPAQPLWALGDDEELWYGLLSGTSMACPVAVGCAALAIDAYLEHHGDVPDPIDVISTLEATADPDAADADGAGTADYTTTNAGAGYVDALAATQRAEDGDLATFDEIELAGEE